MQAIQMAMLFFVLALVLPPLSILGSAVVGLVSLRQGWRSGLEVGLGASLATGLATWLLLGDASLALGSLLFWAPLWLLALLLRYSAALGWTLQWGLLIGLLPWLVELIFLGNRVSAGSGDIQLLLEPLRQSLVQNGVMSAEQAVEVINWMARWLVALVSAGLFAQLCLGLFLARSWQARLYNPGGFGQEFRHLRFSRGLALLALVLLVLTLVGGGLHASWMRVLALLLLILFFLQGLAVLHALLGRASSGRGWLIGVYVLLFLAMPYMGLTLAATGYVDVWRDFRRLAEGRAQRKADTPDPPGGDDAEH
jgi:hypothetical protein